MVFGMNPKEKTLLYLKYSKKVPIDSVLDVLKIWDVMDVFLDVMDCYYGKNKINYWLYKKSVPLKALD